MLHERGDDVTILGRHRYPTLEAQGCHAIQADVRDDAAMRQACEGMDVVFHTAAVPGIWGKRRLYTDINTTGTANVIQAMKTVAQRAPRPCQPRLVYTSSASVAIGKSPVAGADESIPYPDHYLAHYAKTKANAERMVLQANDDDLLTVSLRPHLIIGPGDPHLIPRIIARAANKRLIQIGDGQNRVDTTYIDNAAHAHVLAGDELATTRRCAGKAYFISDGEPITLWPWLGELLRAVGAPPITKHMSYKTAYRLGSVFEKFYSLFGIVREPPMTRFLAYQLAHDHYFNITAARNDFGYTPAICPQEGTKRLIRSLKNVSLPP